jgi:hypothetical protein
MLLLAIRFLVELIGVAALAFVGATAPGETLWRVVLGIGAPLALVVVWALLIAPKARNPLQLRVRSLLGTGLLVLVGVALAVAGQPGWGFAFAGLVVADQVLILILNVDGLAAAIGQVASEGRP